MAADPDLASSFGRYAEVDLRHWIERGRSREDAVRSAADDLVAVFADGEPTAFEDFDAAEFIQHRSRRTKREWALLLAKSVSWRLISTGLLFVIAWWITGSIDVGGLVAIIHMVVTVVIYVPHDLLWEKIIHSHRRTHG